MLPNARFEVTGKTGSGNTRQFTWTARSDRGAVLDGSDTIGLAEAEGRILYHFSSFSVR